MYAVAPPSIADLARVFQPRHLIAEMTSRCNLRCTYCQKSSDSWNAIPGRDDDMPSDAEERLFRSLHGMQFNTVQLSGIGEFTFRKDWQATLGRFLDRGLRVSLISNFAKPFKPDELALFLKLSHLMISIDTMDPDLLKSVRKAVSLTTIAGNLSLLRTLARQKGVSLPYIKLNAVLYRDNLLGIEDLAHFAIENRVYEMQYERMFDMGVGFATPAAIDTADPDHATAALLQIERATAMLREAGVVPSFHGDLIQVLRQVGHRQ